MALTNWAGGSNIFRPFAIVAKKEVESNENQLEAQIQK